MPMWLIKLLGWIIQGKVEGKWSEKQGPSLGGKSKGPGGLQGR